MNILPFVLFSLIILACVSTTFFKERQATFWEERSYTGYMNAERKLRCKVVSAHYAKIRPKKIEAKSEGKKEKKTEKKKNDGPYVNWRERGQLSELSKLNIAPLFHQKSPELYEIAAGLLHELYKETRFFAGPKNGELHLTLLDSFIATGRANKKAVHIKDFFPEDPDLRPIFYKMAKGTRLGYPSLEEFFTFDQNPGRKPISFSYASIPLLKILFGDEATKKILEREHEKWLEDGEYHRLHENEVKEILEKSSKKPFEYYKIQELIDFSIKAPPKKHLVGEDKTTRIMVSKEI